MAVTTYTGNDIVAAALAELGVLGIGETLGAAEANDGFKMLNKLIDAWALQPRLKYYTARSVHSLVANTQTYTLGDGGTFDRQRPERIEGWSVIPDDDATDVQEIPMGRATTAAEWQAISQKSQTGAWPREMWPDNAWAAGLMTLSFWPIPDNSDVDIVLYTKEGLTELASKTASVSYPKGYIRAMEVHLALRLAPRYGAVAAVTPDLRHEAVTLLADIKRINTRPRRAVMRPEMMEHRYHWRQGYDLYNDTGR
jgi:hypothetical protein